MKAILTAALALSLAASSAVVAQPSGPGRDNGRGNNFGQDDRGRRDDQRWSRGERVPDRYLQSGYNVSNYRQFGLRQPGRGERWVRDDNDNFYLVAVATGVILDTLYGNRGQQVSARWSRGDRLPDRYLQSGYYVSNYRQLGLQQPGRNQRWVRDDNNSFYLVANATGVIIQVVYGDQSSTRWTSGQRLPPQYLQSRYYISDYSQLGLRRPTYGQRWVRDDNNNYYLVAIATGIIAEVLYRNDRDQRWNQRHNRTYTYNDDIYYRECRTSSDPAGVIIGALIGGLLGNAAGNRDNRTATTAAGVILGGALGAAMTKDLDCNDRSYAYKTYYNGLNSGRAGTRYQWQNPANGHRGEFNVGRYYNDPDNFRCADFTQTIYINGRPQAASGVACRQPDGTWAIVN